MKRLPSTILRTAVVAAALLLSACGAGEPARSSSASLPADIPHKIGKPYVVAGVRYVPRDDPAYDRVGLASWYGREFHGRRTATGRPFNMYELTAAHQTLPTGTLVRVRNLENGRSVVVVIADRGPFAKGRIIDLSWAAADRLGFVGKGTARVRVTYYRSAQG